MSVKAMSWAFEVALDSPSAKLVLLALADHADETGKCWPSQEKLAQKSAQSIDSVQRRLKELVALGFLTHVHRRRASNIYQISWSESKEPQYAVAKTLEPQIKVKEPQNGIKEPHCCGTEPSLLTVNKEPSERARSRGSRLIEGWKPNEEARGFAERLLGEEKALYEFDKFTDHWRAASGSKGVKSDWDATWKNWCRRSQEFNGGSNGEAKSVHTAARKLTDKIRSFGAEPGSDPIRNGTGAANVRMLPKGGG